MFFSYRKAFDPSIIGLRARLLHTRRITQEYPNKVVRYRIDSDHKKLTAEVTDSYSKSQRNIARSIRQKVTQYFMPQGYPYCVTKQYYPYIKWQMLSSAFISVGGVLSTQSLLFAVGLSANVAIPAAAALNWVIKDGLGQLGAVLFAGRVSNKLDADPKQYRIFAGYLNDFSTLIEILTPLCPQYFLLLASTANIGKNISWITSSSTRASIHLSFIRQGNLADVTAKAGSQMITASLSLCEVALPTLNTQRAEILTLDYLEKAKLGPLSRIISNQRQLNTSSASSSPSGAASVTVPVVSTFPKPEGIRVLSPDDVRLKEQFMIPPFFYQLSRKVRLMTLAWGRRKKKFTLTVPQAPNLSAPLPSSSSTPTSSETLSSSPSSSFASASSASSSALSWWPSDMYPFLLRSIDPALPPLYMNPPLASFNAFFPVPITHLFDLFDNHDYVACIARSRTKSVTVLLLYKEQARSEDMLRGWLLANHLRLVAKAIMDEQLSVTIPAPIAFSRLPSSPAAATTSSSPSSSSPYAQMKTITLTGQAALHSPEAMYSVLKESIREINGKVGVANNAAPSEKDDAGTRFLNAAALEGWDLGHLLFEQEFSSFRIREEVMSASRN